MRAGWLVLVSLLVGCQADTLEQAVSASLAKQDYRLIVRAGRGEVAPGIAPEQQASAKARCGVRYLDGLGMSSSPGRKRPRPSWRRRGLQPAHAGALSRCYRQAISLRVARACEGYTKGGRRELPSFAAAICRSQGLYPWRARRTMPARMAAWAAKREGKSR